MQVAPERTEKQSKESDIPDGLADDVVQQVPQNG